jgi:hypothetical protein
MTDPLEVFRRTVFGPHIKAPWAIRLKDTLAFIEAHPEYQLQVGLIPAQENAFFINSAVCAAFFGFKSRNSLNRDLKQHGFVIDRTSNVAEELRILCPQLTPLSRCWGKRRFAFGEFNGHISATQVERASNYARQVRRRNPQMTQDSPKPIVSIAAGMTSEPGNWSATPDLRMEIDGTEGSWCFENEGWDDV